MAVPQMFYIINCIFTFFENKKQIHTDMFWGKLPSSTQIQPYLSLNIFATSKNLKRVLYSVY